jgi:hypothetical protein
MNKLVLVFLGLVLGLNLQAQNFQNVGPQNVPVASNAGEMDFHITPGGIPYVFYVDNSTGKGNVKKWDGSAWVFVGAPNFTSSNPFNLRLQVDNETEVYVAYYLMNGASERLNVHRNLTGTWGSMSNFGGGPITVNHNRPYDFHVSIYGDVILAFYEDFALNMMIYAVWNGSMFTNPYDDLPEYTSNAIQIEMDEDGTEWVLLADYDIGIGTYLYKRNGSSWSSVGSIYSAVDGSNKLGLETYWDGPANYIQVSVGGIKDGGNDDLFHAQYHNDATPNWVVRDEDISINSNSSVEFDMVSNSTDTYYFEKTGSITKLRKYEHTSGTLTDISLTSIDVAGAMSNLKVELKQNNTPVIAFKNGTNLWVKEDWSTVSFTSSDVFTCSGSSEVFTNQITVTSQNLDNNDISFDIIPDMPAIMHTVSATGNYPDYDLNIGTYFQAADQNVEIDIRVLDEDGNVDTDNQHYADVKANDSIINNLPNTDICINHGPVNMMDYVFPQGGQFTGPILPNGNFNPMMAGAGNHTITYTTYNAGSGCTNSLNIPITVNDIPFLSMNSTDAACGDSTGTASVMTSSTALPHTYYWNTGADSVMLADLPSGQYVVTVTDNNGCMITGVANVGNSAVNIVGNVSGVNCPDDNNGSIDLTVAGVGPFHILWSNGYGTEDITGLVPGPYDVVVTDANGCEGTETFMVTGPDEFAVSSVNTNSSCGADDGSIVLTVTGGTGSYTYQWYDENNNAIGTNSATVTGIGGGLFTCEITDANSCMTTFNTVVNENGAPVVTINQVTNASCANDGEIDMSYTASAALDYIDWSNGASTEDITSLAPGHYAVWVVDVNGCVGMGEADVYPALPATPEICMVTVDSITTTNLVVWEKPMTTGIAHYNIYREGSQAGLYQIVDSVPYTSDSEFNDIVASPMVRSWRYKLSAVDNCGNESALSDYHKTIHATISVGLGGNFNIHWDAYEGLTYTSWSCWRYTDAAGFEWIWTNSSNIFSYTDQPATTAGLDYVVGFPLGSTCTSSIFKAQDYNGTRSNRSAGIFNGSGLGLEEQTNNDFDVVLFPNPNDGEFKVHITGTANGNFDYQIIDIRGKMVSEGTQYLRKFNMNLNTLESGIYYLNITNGGLMKTQKLIIK